MERERVLFRDRTRPISPLSSNVRASLLIGAGGGSLLGVLETAIAVYRSRAGAVQVSDIEYAVLLLPVALYLLTYAGLSLVPGLILGAFPRKTSRILTRPRSTVRFYGCLYLLPLLTLSLYLWWTRVGCRGDLFERAPLALLSFIVAGYPALYLVAARCLDFSARKRLTRGALLAVPILGLAIFLGIRIGGMGDRQPREGAPGPGNTRLNVLLITMDTTRADFLGCYGNRRTETPHIDALAAGGAVFLNASAQVPITLPSHLSIFTSTYPPVHGVRTNQQPRRLRGSMTMMAELFRDQGYRTGAFVSSYVLSHFFGTEAGFEVYDDHFDQNALRYLARAKPKLTLVSLAEAAGITLGRLFERRAEGTTTRALGWLDRIGSEDPFFLWIHYYDPHSHYDPPAPYDGLYLDRHGGDEEAEARIEFVRNYSPKQEDTVELTPEELRVVRGLYRGEVSYMDHHIGRVISHLEEEGLLERTLIVATADHGETLGEHDTLGHSRWVHQEIIGVPLLFQLPGRIAPSVIEKEVVQSIDILPTVLELAAIPCPAQVQGRSLVPILRGERSEGVPAYFESLKSESLEKRVAGIRSGPWKYIFHPWGEGESLFNLEEDPMETNNRVATERDRARSMRESALSILAPDVAEEPGEAIEMTPESLDALRALGYVQ